MNKKIAIGYHDFERMIEEGSYYIDKTRMIQKIVEDQKMVFLLPRPRRFGKTLNMMMLRRFFEISETSKAHLFEGLYIQNWSGFEKYQGNFPVIWLSMKDVKFNNWQSTRKDIIGLIQSEFLRHRFLLQSDKVTENLKNYFQKITSSDCEDADLVVSIRRLCEMLTLYHNAKPILLIDEYDTPINNAFTQGFYEECVGFLRLLYSNCLKDNDYMERAVMTGIYRVAKESIFSGLNNLKVSSILDDDFADDFGFTPDEVHQLLADFNALSHEEEVKRWYNGYLFGAGKVIYNPWSILNFVANSQRELMPYWVNTSSNDIIKKLIVNSSAKVKQEIEILLEGGTIQKSITEDVVFGNIQEAPDAIWNFFMFSGYLKIVERNQIENKQLGLFKIPNIEIRTIFEDSVLYWFVKADAYDDFSEVLHQLKRGKIEDFSYYFMDFVEKVCSYYDFADREPERIYHALVLGLMVQLKPEYHIQSNRESGYGRYDVLLIPKSENLPGFVFEFKKFNSGKEKDLDETLESAMVQMKENKYASELTSKGIKEIYHIAIAFKGKEVKMKYE